MALSGMLGLGVCHQTDVKLDGFPSWLGATGMSSNTDVLLYNETVHLWLTIYIYIYMSNSL